MRFSLVLLLLASACSNSSVHTNALIHEASPYLLQHAHNPVDWMPWGDAAFEKARAENKPVFLSVGYAACHWCHVMEHESFENEEIAEFLNGHFVSIKVDREERPDVDHHYMQAVQRMTGSGGWPMSVFLMPDRKPFYGGTYWAPEARYGRPGFMDVLQALAKAWETERDSLLAASDQMHDAIHAEIELPPATSKLSPALLDSAVKASERNFDPVNGGFSRAPKFPHAMELAMLLRYYSRTGDDSVKHMVEFTLDKMARGGIFDQIGGGFHRYSTDDQWLVPHFEKMLYDNALLLKVYQDATLVSPLFLTTSGQIGLWLNREMKLDEGGYASSLDADSDGEEGVYYVWTPQDITDAIPDFSKTYCRCYDITELGNFENGTSIPNLLKTEPFIVGSEDDVLYVEANAKLLRARETRNRPARDDKALCDWNGLIISALSQTGMIKAATETANRFVAPFERDGELVHSFLGDKELRIQLLADYAALGNGLLDLFCVTGDVRWFDNAYKLADEIERRFAKGDGLYYMSEDSVAGVRSVDLYDSAMPSGNSLAGNLLIKLYYLTGEEKFFARAESQINTLMPYLERMPTAFAQAMLTAEWLLYPPEQVIIVSPAGKQGEGRVPNHNRQVISIDDQFVDRLPTDHPLRPLFEGKNTDSGKPTYYYCRNFTCELPTTDWYALTMKMKKPWQK
ncbi:MAG: thioredoxin domain-containing protein [Calditrichaeota bacterium]|nr:thioredoxin domain-containing protein [Calditrichota bacterium]MCB9368027.1 thioredoxin domain-containing protein [Calditrichota bacterium]